MRFRDQWRQVELELDASSLEGSAGVITIEVDDYPHERDLTASQLRELAAEASRLANEWEAAQAVRRIGS